MSQGTREFQGLLIAWLPTGTTCQAPSHDGVQDKEPKGASSCSHGQQQAVHGVTHLLSSVWGSALPLPDPGLPIPAPPPTSPVPPLPPPVCPACAAGEQFLLLGRLHLHWMWAAPPPARQAPHWPGVGDVLLLAFQIRLADFPGAGTFLIWDGLNKGIHLLRGDGGI